MQEEDWIIRQINQLGRILGKILADLMGLKDQGRVGEGIEAARQTLISELDLNIDDLTSIPIEQFVSSLKDNKNLSDDNLDNLAGIFYLIAEELDRTGANEEMMVGLYERALTIYEYLDMTGSTYSFDRHDKIEKIKKAL